MSNTTPTTTNEVRRTFGAIHWGQILAFLHLREVVQVTRIGKTIELGACRFLTHRRVELDESDVLSGRKVPWFEAYLRRSARVVEELIIYDASRGFEMGKLFYKLMDVGMPELKLCCVTANFEARSSPTTLSLPSLCYLDLSESHFHGTSDSIRFVLDAPCLHSVTLRGCQVRLFDHHILNYRMSIPRHDLALIERENEIYGVREDVSPSLVLRYQAELAAPNVVLTVNRACPWKWESIDELPPVDDAQKAEWSLQELAWGRHVREVSRLAEVTGAERLLPEMIPKLDPGVAKGAASCGHYAALDFHMLVKRILRPFRAAEVFHTGVAWEKLHTVEDVYSTKERGLQRLPLIMRDFKTPEGQEVIEWEPSRAEIIAPATTTIAWLNIKAIRRDDRECLLKHGAERLALVQSQLKGSISLEIDEAAVEDEILTLEALIKTSKARYLLICDGFRSSTNLLRLYCLLYYIFRCEHRRVTVRSPAMQLFEPPWDEVQSSLFTGRYRRRAISEILYWLGVSRELSNRFLQLENREDIYKQLREIVRKGSRHPAYPNIIGQLKPEEAAVFDESYRLLLSLTKKLHLPSCLKFLNPLVGLRVMSPTEPGTGYAHSDDIIQWIADM